MDEDSKREEKAYAAGAVATENYVTQCRADDKPLTMQGLKAAVRKEVFAAIGQPPKPPKRVRLTPEQVEEGSWYSTRALKRQAYAAVASRKK